jgi:hypothetical protein
VGSPIPAPPGQGGGGARSLDDRSISLTPTVRITSADELRLRAATRRLARWRSVDERLREAAMRGRGR